MLLLVVTTHILQYYGAKQTFTYAYEFDSHGNWIKKMTTKDLDSKDFPEGTTEVSVSSREIFYY